MQIYLIMQRSYNMSEQNNWKEEFDKRFCSFNLKSWNMSEGKPFDGSSIADTCGSADEYIKSFISSLLSSQAHALKEQMKKLITEEIATAHTEGVATSRLTSLYNKVSAIESIEI